MIPIFSAPFWIDLGLLFLSIFLFILTADYPEMAGTFPRLVLIMIMTVTVLDMLKIIRAQRRGEIFKKTSPHNKVIGPRQYWKVCYMVALIGIFFFFLILFGVMVGTFLYLMLSGWTLGYKNLRNLLISSTIITASVYIIFKVIMNSFLPEGLIFTIIGG